MDIKKILLVALIAVAIVASVSAVSAWLFDSGKEVTVNGINFHLPEEFDVDNPIKYDNWYGDENIVYGNTKNNDTVDIDVSLKTRNDLVIANDLITAGYSQMNINGKDGFYAINTYTKNVEFLYIEKDKVVSIIVPYTYDNSKQYDEFLAEIII